MLNKGIFFSSIMIFLCFNLLIHPQIFAQDKNVLAQSQYYKAEEAYNAGNFDDALKYLNKAEEYSGNNHLIQYLKVKSHYMNRDYIAAQQAMAIFFDIIDPDLQNTSKYKEMVMMVADIEEAAQRRKEAMGSMTDPRDGKTYQTIAIGTQVWMAENLNYKTSSGSWAYDNEPSNAATYGRLYNWKTALKVCPDGWHLPFDEEWDILAKKYGEDVAGKALKSTTGWENNRNGSNRSGFNAKPAGYRYSDGSFYNVGKIGYFWSSSEESEYNAWKRSLNYNDSEVSRYNLYKSNAYSCRCLRD